VILIAAKEIHQGAAKEVNLKLKLFVVRISYNSLGRNAQYDVSSCSLHSSVYWTRLGKCIGNDGTLSAKGCEAWCFRVTWLLAPGILPTRQSIFLPRPIRRETFWCWSKV